MVVMKTSKLIPEIFELLLMAETDEEKAQILRSYDTNMLREFLRLAFDPSVKFDVEIPEYQFDDSPTGLSLNSLYQEMRRMYLFQEQTKHITPAKKKDILAQILESIHASEAMLLEALIRKDLSDYEVTEEVVRLAFPKLLPEKTAAA